MYQLRTFKKEIHKELIDAYWKALRNVTEADFDYCITKILQDDKAFPKVPRFREILSRIRNGAEQGYIRKVSAHESFHCRDCDEDFSVILATNDNSMVTCPGSCGRRWTVGELKTRMLDAQERQQDTIVL